MNILIAEIDSKLKGSSSSSNNNNNNNNVPYCSLLAKTKSGGGENALCFFFFFWESDTCLSSKAFFLAKESGNAFWPVPTSILLDGENTCFSVDFFE